MPFHAEPLVLSEEEHDELRQVSFSRSLPAGDVFRARLILMLAQDRSYADIQQRLERPQLPRFRDGASGSLSVASLV